MSVNSTSKESKKQISMRGTSKEKNLINIVGIN